MAQAHCLETEHRKCRACGTALTFGERFNGICEQCEQDDRDTRVDTSEEQTDGDPA